MVVGEAKLVDEKDECEQFSKVDALQLSLDAAGLAPGPIGVVADISSAGVAVYRGDYTGAALSLGSAVPLVGGVFAYWKYTRYADETGEFIVDAYKNVSKRSDIPGQAHHLNQDAAFRSHIRHGDGVSIKLEGDAFQDVGSPHYDAHECMEGFWSIFRRGGLDENNLPTNSEYNRALYNSLQEAGVTAQQALEAVRAAKKQQLNAGLRGQDFVPRVPQPINQVPRIKEK